MYEKPLMNPMYAEMMHYADQSNKQTKINNFNMSTALRPLRIHNYYNQYLKPNTDVIKRDEPVDHNVPMSRLNRINIKRLKEDAELYNMMNKKKN
jgi:hypothetical protein